MTVLVDTSALLAVFDPREEPHTRCVDELDRLREASAIVSTNYVVAEALAVVHRRYPLGHSRRFAEQLLAPIDVRFVDGRLHELGLASFLAANRRGDSFVDHVSFALMRDRGITTAFTLDQDFAREGFEVVP